MGSPGFRPRRRAAACPRQRADSRLALPPDPADWLHFPVPFQSHLEARCALVDDALNRLLPPENEAPATLHRAIRYSIFAGGKRLRPVLVLAAAEACGGAIENAMPGACAVECLHTYSLIHDDLPCMDDDDVRRGRPTSHKVFGDAIAVLAGDALQAMAFEAVCQMPASSRYTGADYVSDLARAAGSRHLIAGQVMDLEGEGRQLSVQELRAIHGGKTAALLTCCARLGGMSAGCPAGELESLTRFGRALGLAFQVIDDILDVTQTSEKLGKTAGKDASAAKATFPAILGIEASRAEAAKLTAQARRALEPFGPAGARLGEIADYLLGREY
jgi:geranylgeranyl diphosphate synthase, type II